MKLLTLKDAAAFLGVHYDTVYEFVTTGKLPAVRLGGRRKWQVIEEDLIQFVEASRVSRGPNRGPELPEKPPIVAQNKRARNAAGPRPHEWRKAFRGR